MKARGFVGGVSVDLASAEARLLLEELLDIPGGSRLPKVRQVCALLDTALSRPAVHDEPHRIPKDFECAKKPARRKIR